jgi:5S rRNA maturation endonuclease (ribonuclease M5)
MNPNSNQLLTLIEKYQDHLLIVEGKKDRKALEDMGFANIFVLNHDGKSLGEKIEEIEALAGKREICILTDFDKKGRKLFQILKAELGQKNVKLDSTLRMTLEDSGVRFIEDLSLKQLVS